MVKESNTKLILKEIRNWIAFGISILSAFGVWYAINSDITRTQEKVNIQVVRSFNNYPVEFIRNEDPEFPVVITTNWRLMFINTGFTPVTVTDVKVNKMEIKTSMQITGITDEDQASILFPLYLQPQEPKVCTLMTSIPISNEVLSVIEDGIEIDQECTYYELINHLVANEIDFFGNTMFQGHPGEVHMINFESEEFDNPIFIIRAWTANGNLFDHTFRFYDTPYGEIPAWTFAADTNE